MSKYEANKELEFLFNENIEVIKAKKVQISKQIANIRDYIDRLQKNIYKMHKFGTKQ